MNNLIITGTILFLLAYLTRGLMFTLENIANNELNKLFRFNKKELGFGWRFLISFVLLTTILFWPILWFDKKIFNKKKKARKINSYEKEISSIAPPSKKEEEPKVGTFYQSGKL